MTVNNDWLPEGEHWGIVIRRTPTGNGGEMTPGAGHKVCLHTTSGISFSGADSTLRGNDDEPHFLIGRDSGSGAWRVNQYIPLSQSSRALRHPAGTLPTNGAGCIQIEMCGFASVSDAVESLHRSPTTAEAKLYCPPTYYDAIAALCCLIEHRVNVPRQEPHVFHRPGATVRFTPQQFMSVRGYVGHSMVPNNDHTDPGAFDCSQLFKAMARLTKAHAPG